MTDVSWKVMDLSAKICIPTLSWIPCINPITSCQSSNFAKLSRQVKFSQGNNSKCECFGGSFVNKCLEELETSLVGRKVFFLYCCVWFCRICESARRKSWGVSCVNSREVLFLESKVKCSSQKAEGLFAQKNEQNKGWLSSSKNWSAAAACYSSGIESPKSESVLIKSKSSQRKSALIQTESVWQLGKPCICGNALGTSCRPWWDQALSQRGKLKKLIFVSCDDKIVFRKRK